MDSVSNLIKRARLIFFTMENFIVLENVQTFKNHTTIVNRKWNSLVERLNCGLTFTEQCILRSAVCLPGKFAKISLGNCQADFYKKKWQSILNEKKYTSKQGLLKTKR